MGEREQGKELKMPPGRGRFERMKRGNEIRGRDDRSSGVEILMTDGFVKIKPTDPLRLPKPVDRRKRN
jgi:hypothetical protein